MGGQELRTGWKSGSADLLFCVCENEIKKKSKYNSFYTHTYTHTVFSLAIPRKSRLLT